VPPPPPLEDEPPQAAMKTSPENIMQPNKKHKIRLLRELKPAPSSASPPMGSHIA
jgi:hypothetical protein